MIKTIPVYPYMQLAEDIREKILAGELQEGAKLDPIRKLAEDTNLSYVTVVKALDRLVDEGYLVSRPRDGIYVNGGKNHVVKGKKIGIVVLKVSYQAYSPDSVSGESNMGMNTLHDSLCDKKNRVQILGCIHRDREDQQEWEFVNAHKLAESLDGIIIGGIYDFDYIHSFTKLGLPLLAFDLDASNLYVDSVFFDNTGSAFELTKLLLDRGHRRIAYLGRAIRILAPHMQPDPCVFEREDGYRLALRLHGGLEPLVFYAERGLFDYKDALEQALRAAPDCTAVVAEAYFDHPLIRERNLEMAIWKPRHASARSLPPCVAAAAECDFDVLGGIAADLILNRISDPRAPIARRMLAPEIVLGKPAER